MGLFKKIKTSFKIAKEKATKLQKYENLPKPFLAGLPANELTEALDLMVEFTIGQYEGEEAVSRLPFHEQVWYVLSQYSKEMAQGGLGCFYAASSGKKAAPFVSDALAAVGAEKMRALYDTFNCENGIHVNHLDAFETTDPEMLAANEKKYPFDAFNEAYSALHTEEPIMEMALTLARKEIDR